MVIILEFKEFLKKSKDARMVFGKRELEIIFKQLDGLEVSPSEKNRLSRDIKPKLEFIKTAAKFEKEFRLKKNQDNDGLIERAVEVILEDKLGQDIKAILLFGSFADNSFTRRSDIDICAVFKKEMSLKDATEFRIRVAGQLSDKMDVQVFNILPQKVKREIARNHRVLYKDAEYDNINFSIRYLKEEGYFIRLNEIFGAAA